MTLSLFKRHKEQTDLLSDKKAFFDALDKMDPKAVRLLGKKIESDIKQAARNGRLSPEDAEELVNDAVVTTVSNIRKGTFPFIDSSPVAYAKGVGQKLIANRIRKQRPQSEDLSIVQVASDFNPEKYIQDKERRNIVKTLLGRLGENCRNLLQLKYFSHLRDKEAIDKGMAAYTTVGSMRAKRSQCLKELEGLARGAGITQVFLKKRLRTVEP